MLHPTEPVKNYLVKYIGSWRKLPFRTIDPLCAGMIGLYKIYILEEYHQ